MNIMGDYERERDREREKERETRIVYSKLRSAVNHVGLI